MHTCNDLYLNLFQISLFSIFFFIERYLFAYWQIMFNPRKYIYKSKTELKTSQYLKQHRFFCLLLYLTILIMWKMQ